MGGAQKIPTAALEEAVIFSVEFLSSMRDVLSCERHMGDHVQISCIIRANGTTFSFIFQFLLCVCFYFVQDKFFYRDICQAKVASEDGSTFFA